MAFRFRCQSCDAVHDAEEIGRQKTMKCPTCGFASLEMEIVSAPAKSSERTPAQPPAGTADAPPATDADTDGDAGAPDPDATIAPTGRGTTAPLDAAADEPPPAPDRATLLRDDNTDTDATLVMRPDSDAGATVQQSAADMTLTPGQLRQLQAPTRDMLLGKSLGNCELQERIGAGAMGVVYRGFHLTLKRAVAVKVMPADLAADPARTKQFLIEAQAAARLEHQNIVQVYDVGQEGGTVYIVMQFIEGESLGAILRRRRILPIPEAVQLMIQAARGLGAAHAESLVHQDVKPENILVPRRGNEAKVADFGLAADVRKGMGSDEVVGTPAYISPEQVTRLPIGAHTDIYSLGATLYHLVTGTPVFEMTDIRNLMLAHVNEPPEPANLRNPAIPESLSDILGRLLEKEASRRPASMAEVIELLTPYLSDQRETAAASRGGTDLRVPLRLAAGALLVAASTLPFLVPAPQPDVTAWTAALDAADPARAAERTARLHAAKYPGTAATVRGWLDVAARYPGGALAARARERAAGEQSAYLRSARQRATDYDLAGRSIEAALLLAGVARLQPDTPTAREALDEAEVYRRKASAGGRVLVLGGTYRFAGSPVVIPDMLVDRTEITAGAYLQWCTSSGTRPPEDDAAGAPKPAHPITGVTRDEAVAYAAAQHARLPSEAEWEWIAQAAEAGEFPWAGPFDSSRAVHRDGGTDGTRPAGSLPDGASRWGVLDCAGNVHEWVAASGVSGVGDGAVKGGGYDSPPRMLRRTARLLVPANGRFRSVGFRTVLDVRAPE